MNPRKFLDQARRLALLTEEEDWRTSVSRAYYAAFHVARELLTGLGFTVPNGEQAHAYLWLRLSNCGDLRTQDAGADLKSLRGRRNRADYDLSRPFRAGEAPVAIQFAETIIRSLDAAAVEPVRSQITNAMKSYEQSVLRVVTWHP
jgi:uncharacterized protein (UPF0332 family)